MPFLKKIAHLNPIVKQDEWQIIQIQLDDL